MQKIQHPKDTAVVNGDPPGRTNLRVGEGQRLPAEVVDGHVEVPDAEAGAAMDALEEAYAVEYDRETRSIDEEATQQKRAEASDSDDSEDEDMTDDTTDTDDSTDNGGDNE